MSRPRSLPTTFSQVSALAAMSSLDMVSKAIPPAQSSLLWHLEQCPSSAKLPSAWAPVTAPDSPNAVPAVAPSASRALHKTRGKSLIEVSRDLGPIPQNITGPHPFGRFLAETELYDPTAKIPCLKGSKAGSSAAAMAHGLSGSVVTLTGLDPISKY